MYYVLLGVYVFICVLLLVVVLLQQGKGGDIAAAFGGWIRRQLALFERVLAAAAGLAFLSGSRAALFAGAVLSALVLILQFTRPLSPGRPDHGPPS